ncbi:DUF4097 family beta strand repeat-containing protein [Paenibacillus silvae]|jgi:DUF4097 and DUF4098 domain-containing protein YvlB|uniref:DUF4097 family beta strand repeat-containing protein n=1 Tax=Paenibacillus silvae TaxID=1325358 RepID=UPI0025A2CBF4|nr:DUF4097 family beta strand repeat-containing protein [Paenibacillus silvae]MDM5281706.1 DUF4097 family beta strand repeat-containing protein [Paenibacillus silvae]
MNRKIRVGRYTAAALIIAVGVLLILDKRWGTDYLYEVVDWWPFLLVSFGVEWIFLFLWTRRRSRRDSEHLSPLDEPQKRRFRPDAKGILSSLILTASVFIVTEQDHYMHLWNRVSLNLGAASMDYSQAAGYMEDKGVIGVPVRMDTSDIVVEGVNGDITLQRGETDEIKVKTVVWVDQASEVQAKAVAAASFVEVEGDKVIRIKTTGKAYGDNEKTQPRMNMTITVPDDRRFNLDIRTSNGAILLNRPEAIKTIVAETGNGRIRINNAVGDITGKTLNGDVIVANATGNVDMDSNRGDMKARGVSGDVDLTTQVGSISITDSFGEFIAETRNGNITLDSANLGVKAQSLNGSINIVSTKVGGDWDVYSAVGAIDIVIPERGDYSLTGSSSYGDLRTDMPFNVKNKTIEGQLGEGEYRIKIEGNSDLTVQRNAEVPGLENNSTESQDTNENGGETTDSGPNANPDTADDPASSR